MSLATKKRITILCPHGHRLANQLWNFASIYAYCLEKGYPCENPSFFRYYQFFDIAKNNTGRLLSFFNRAPSQKIRGWSYMLFERYVTEIKRGLPSQVISDKKEPHVFYLPPSNTEDTEYQKMLARIDAVPQGTFYFNGWLFRNPVGIEKYRKEIREYFAPKRAIQEKVDAVISPLREEFSEVIGVHIRQGDYKEFQNGEFFFSQQEIRATLDDYLHFFKKETSQTAFVFCSDGPIDRAVFDGLNAVFPKGDAVEDLFTLAKTDTVIGPNSTFGAFASYYGDIPFVVLEHGKIDWAYYRDKETYFKNKKNTLTFY